MPGPFHPFHQMPALWRDRPHRIAAGRVAAEVKGFVVAQRDFTAGPEMRERGFQAAWLRQRAGSALLRGPGRGDHVVVAGPGVAGQVTGEQGRPVFGRGFDLAENVGEQDGRVRVGCGQPGEAVGRGEAIQAVEGERRGVRPAAQQPAGQGVGFQRGHAVEALDETRRQRVAGIGADDHEPGPLRLPGGQPFGHAGMEGRPQTMAIAQGAQVVDEPAARVEQMVVKEGRWSGHARIMPLASPVPGVPCFALWKFHGAPHERSFARRTTVL